MTSTDRLSQEPDGSTNETFRALGLFFEDYHVGDHFEHPLGRTITEADNTWFTLLTMNTNELHFNSDVANRSPHGRKIVNSGLSVAVVLGISVSDISQNALANLGWDDIRLLSPLFEGDTLDAESLITEVRSSKSRPHAGIVSCVTRGLNQHGDDILTFNRSAMILRREAGTALREFPSSVTPLERFLPHK
jgi:acyl dehydratase